MRCGTVRQMLKAGMIGSVLLVTAMGTGLSRDGVVEAQRNAPQSTRPEPGMMPPLDQPAGTMPNDGARARMEAERMKSFNDDRHKRLASDVDKLMSLTNELKADLDKTNKDELSIAVIRKAQEIEKLAHDVQNRMKN